MMNFILDNIGERLYWIVLLWDIIKGGEGRGRPDNKAESISAIGEGWGGLLVGVGLIYEVLI